MYSFPSALLSSDFHGFLLCGIGCANHPHYPWVKVLNLLFIFIDISMSGLELAAQVANSDDEGDQFFDADDMAEADDEAPRELSTYCLYFHNNVLNHLSPDPLPIMQLFTVTGH